jgi:hypothetical protein
LPVVDDPDPEKNSEIFRFVECIIRLMYNNLLNRSCYTDSGELLFFRSFRKIIPVMPESFMREIIRVCSTGMRGRQREGRGKAEGRQREGREKAEGRQREGRCLFSPTSPLPSFPPVIPSPPFLI